MSRAIPSSYSEYIFDQYSYRQNPPMIVNGGIMPLRNGTGLNAPECLRGEDIIFLTEAVLATRGFISNLQWLTAGILNKVSRQQLLDIKSYCSNMKNYWGNSYSAGNLYAWPTQGVKPTDTQVRQKILEWIGGKGVDFSANDTYTSLQKSEIINLFKNVKQYNYSLSGAATNSSLLYYDWGIDNDEISTNWVYWRPDPTINTYHHTDDRYFNYNTGTWQFDSDGPYSYYTVEYKNFNANVTWNGSSQGVPVQGVTHWMHEAYEAHPVYFLRFTNSAQTGNNDGYYYEYTKEYYAVMDVTNLWSDLKDQTPLTFTTPDDLSTVFAAVGQQVGDPLYANLADVPIQYVVGQDGAYWYSKNTDCFVEGVYLVVHPLHTNLEGITIS